ncbi:MAG: YraN family protein, partial [Phycisphaerales bacterium]|nr:YraN family protein [Phycisphaerales bacterium]
RCGLRILGRNRRIRNVEIDLLAYDPGRDELVIVEVKTSAFNGDPTRRIDRQKRKRLIRAARALSKNHRVRIEAIGITLHPTIALRRYGDPDQSGR